MLPADPPVSHPPAGTKPQSPQRSVRGMLRGMWLCWDGGKGLCLTEMIPWGKEGRQGRESCNDAHRVGADGHLSARGFGCLVAEGLPTPSCLLGSRDSNSSATKSSGQGINGGRDQLPQDGGLYP